MHTMIHDVFYARGLDRGTTIPLGQDLDPIIRQLDLPFQSPVAWCGDEWNDFVKMVKAAHAESVVIRSTNCSVVIHSFGSPTRIRIITETIRKDLKACSMDEALKYIRTIFDAVRNGSMNSFLNKAKLLGM